MNIHEELYKQAANAVVEWQEGVLTKLMEENEWTVEQTRENIQVMCYVDTIGGSTTHFIDILSKRTGKVLHKKAFQINFTGGMV